MSTPFFNRELSWLEFNQRVLDEALNESNPLLERMKFLAITASNLDEFFMVRVGGLIGLIQSDHRKKDPAGMTPNQQLEAIAKRVKAMAEQQQNVYNLDLEPSLAEGGVRRIRADQLSDRQRWFCEQFFENEVFPVLSPAAIEDGRSAPLIRNRLLHLAVRIRKPEETASDARIAMIPMGPALDRMISLPDAEGHGFILMEELIEIYIHRFFEGYKVLETVAFRITRNADLSLQEDQGPDLLAGMEGILEARKTSNCVRLEIQNHCTRILERRLKAFFEVDDRFIYRSQAPVFLGDFMDLAFINEFDDLKLDPWPPVPSPLIEPSESMFENIRERDILLYHPYESFDAVVRFIQEAADDPDVLAIKQILYRTSKNSPVVSALMRAAEKGKYVTALVELKARFDEQRNIEWARELELAGVQVIYGIRGLKTHAKLCLVVRKEPEGIQRYMHFGTGNYNEATARIYSDASYLTCNPDLGRDASMFFNTITGFSQPQGYQRIEAAPLTLRDRILHLIDREIEAAEQGRSAHIMAKVNSLVDPVIIKALYRASSAGVHVQLNIRGICCLVPGRSGLSERIEVISVVDRFLEHARILVFKNAGAESVWISSADWMPRNLDRRVELLTPVIDPASRKRLEKILETYFKDQVNAWELKSDGQYLRRTPSKKKTVGSQETLYRRAKSAYERAVKNRPQLFEPYRSEPGGAS